jgi:hypothetical protein
VEYSKLFNGYFLFLEPSAEKKPVVESAEVECCELQFDVKKLTRVWKI